LSFWPFRRKETLTERLIREAGLDGSPQHEPVAAPDPTELENSWLDERSLSPFERLSGEITAARPRRWDAVVSAETDQIRGAEVEFVALPDGSLIVDEEQGDGDLTPLADAVETQIPAPYRAQAVRRGADRWAVSARRIDVVSFEAEGDEIELSVHGDERTLMVDGARAFGRLPELERLGGRQGTSYVVRAQRLEGDTWEVRVDPL
jgi:hypothetical protein